jgi:hypothetical protein
MITLDETHKAARIKVVEEHVQSENLHDVEAMMRTFGDTAQYYDEPWSEHHAGRGGSADTMKTCYALLLT